jgi:hypothetical protein
VNPVPSTSTSTKDFSITQVILPWCPWRFFFQLLIEESVVTVAIGADRISGKSSVGRRFFLLVAVMAFQTGRINLRSSIDDVRRSDIVFV